MFFEAMDLYRTRVGN